MAFLVRKLSRAKWPNEGDLEIQVDEINADAITADLKTDANSLSTWEIDHVTSIENAVLALAANRDKIEKIDIIKIEKDEVLTCGFSCIDTPGITKVQDLVHTHKDISNLTYKTIGDFAKLIIDSLRKEHFERYSKKQVLAILKKAIEDGRLDFESLNDGIKEQLLKETG